MIVSMTGFGSTVKNYPEYKIECEIKCLNSRGIDFVLNLPRYLNSKEIEIRNILTQRLERGKIFVNLSVEFSSLYEVPEVSIDEYTAISYWNEIKKLSEKLNIPISEHSFVQLLSTTEIWKKDATVISETLWKDILEVLSHTIEKVLDFRIQEGENIAQLLQASIFEIENLAQQIDVYEVNRIPILKERLLQLLNEYNVNLNEDRLMQELVYYAERYDISEEKTRLKHHCQYFMESLAYKENNGKKLQFIAQEIHREINTLGVKSNHVEIQKIVVKMKEEIEKIKEQLSNIA